MSDKQCGNCAYRSDGINTLSLDYCYCIDAPVTRNAPACPEHRGSLRDEPVNEPPAKEAPLVTKDVITYPLSAFMEDEDVQ